MNPTDKIYIAGHRGLVGSALMRRLQNPPSPARGTSPQGAGQHEVLVPNEERDGPKAHRGAGGEGSISSPPPHRGEGHLSSPPPHRGEGHLSSPPPHRGEGHLSSPSPLRGEGRGEGKAPYANLVTRTHAELDLTNQAAVDAFFAEEKPDYVFLAAAKVGGIHANNAYPAEFIRDNLAIQTNVIHAAWKHGVKRLLFLGSSCIYPKHCPQPMKEEYLLTGPLEPTNRPYALAKIAGIEMCWSYNRQYGTQYLAVMPTNLYGAGDNYHLENSHVIPAMIRKFHLAKLAQQGDLAGILRDEALHGPIPPDIKEMIGLDPDAPITRHSALGTRNSVVLWGTGTPRREFLYSDDMADACVHLMNLPDEQFNTLLGSGSKHTPSPLRGEGRWENRESERFLKHTPSPLRGEGRGGGEGDFMPPVVNIGVGEDLTIKELAETVKEVVGYQGEIAFDASKPDGTPRKLMDVSRLHAIDWQAPTAFKAGLAQAYRDFLGAHE